MFCLYFANLMFCRNEFELDLRIRMLLLQWDMFQPPKCSYIKKLCMNCGSKIFQGGSLFIILRNLIPHTVLMNSWLITDIARMWFCTPDGILDSTFQNKYLLAI